MSMLTWIWLASIAGAALFAGTGWFFARAFEERRQGRGLRAARDRERELESLLASEREQGRAREHVAARAQRELAELQSRLDGDKRAVETLREENGRLRAELARLGDVMKRVTTLTAENARLQTGLARARADEKVRQGKASSADGMTPRANGNAIDNASLQRFVDDVVKVPSVSAAAVTDELGFLVAGGGEHIEALAAFGAYLTDAAAKACGLLPIEAVHKVSIHDGSGLTLTARTIAPAPNELVLVTLGVDEKHDKPTDRTKQRGPHEHTSR